MTNNAFSSTLESCTQREIVFLDLACLVRHLSEKHNDKAIPTGNRKRNVLFEFDLPVNRLVNKSKLQVGELYL